MQKIENIYHKAAFTAFVLLLTLIGTCVTQADGTSFSHAVSDSLAPFLVVGEISLLSNKHEAAQSAKALVVTALATEFLKRTVQEKRPNGEDRTSFPSGHTSAAFAMATVLAEYKPKYKYPAYAIAGAIGWSRVENHAHYWHDVIAGALLGHFIAKHFTNEHIYITPQGAGFQFKW